MTYSDWHKDRLFVGSEALQGSRQMLKNCGSPAFKVSLQSSIFRGHFLDHVEPYERLFALFKPFLEENAKRLVMTDQAGMRPRRRKSIKKEDWHPFRYLKEKTIEPNRTFLGFDFQSDNENATEDIRDSGPIAFNAFVDRNLKIDIAIPVEVFEAGLLNIDDLISCLSDIPVTCGSVGYGVILSRELRHWGEDVMQGQLLPITKKYPFIDITSPFSVHWFSPGDDENYNRCWPISINWITLIGEPIRSALQENGRDFASLSKEIEIHERQGSTIFKLGSRPIAGADGDSAALARLYFELGSVLAPIGNGHPSADHPGSPVFGRTREIDSLHWRRRFFDQEWFRT